MDKKTDSVLIVISHLCCYFGFGVIVPLIIYLLKRDDENCDAFAIEHIKAALNFQISLYIYCIAAGILCMILIGFLLLPILAILGFIFPIIATIKGINGEPYKYPIAINFIK